MTGEVTGGNFFVLASFIASGVTMAALAAWTATRLAQAKKKLNMLNQTENPKD